uniref:Uncharacterized protein n=1 Tax=Odontella aurita TaxID=265563 RepID=A0A7S4HJV5_9STRA|mmetsp:Transcript_11173/g.33093  ORF Transcript_11173/g.33093 Transcript_11173/m.33093 type:complete len:303 (+) Transcript_11173:172-1080(+)
MSASGWGLTTALSDWGIGGATRSEEDSAGGADSGETPKTETKPASDVEVDSMTKEMESSVTSALASLGFGSTISDAPQSAEKEQQLVSTAEDGAPKVETTLASDEELASITKEMESSLSSALSGFGFGDSANRSDQTPTETQGVGVNEGLAPKIEVEKAAAAASSAIWSTFETVSELKAPSAVIGEWIEDLQKENELKDPHKSLRDSLDGFLKDRPSAKYEEWVEHLLISEGWDEDSAVVDDSFYWEKSAHRNVWNERNIEDGIKVEEAEAKRAYVAAMDSKLVATSAKSLSENSEEEVVFE